MNVKPASYVDPPVRVNGGKAGCGNRMTPEEAAWCGMERDLLCFTAAQYAQRAEHMKARVAFEERG